MKIFCIGSNLESFISLKYLVAHNCDIDTLITLPSGFDKGVSDYYDLHDLCAQNNIKTIDTTNVNDEETISQVKSEKPDYLFTLGWSQIFKKDFLNAFSGFIVGSHPTDLPYGRGRAPIVWSILEGLEKSAVSFFKIDEGVDSGELLLKKYFTIPKCAYAEELYLIVADKLGEGFHEIYQALKNNNLEIPRYTLPPKITHRGKRIPEDGLLAFHRSACYNEKLIRATSYPYPGAYFYYNDERFTVWRVRKDELHEYIGTTRQILQKKDMEILVQFEDGCLWLSDIRNFKNENAINQFRVGTKLGYSIEDQIFYLRNKN